ncbi:hypothetical protein M8J76_004458 [Diaphorina citri]|nr:hypothetical protein M8J76_004458 [Diaphorina citri]
MIREDQEEVPEEQKKKRRKQRKRRRSTMTRCSAAAHILGKASIPLLTLHSSVNIILTHYVRCQNTDFLTSSAVFISEVFKLAFCLFVLVGQQGTNLRLYLAAHFRLIQLVKLVVPAAMFTLQNNLFYMANTNLDSITYQITYQLKIITTALFSYLLLSKRFTKTQVFSLGVLLFGIVLIQIDESASESISRKSDNGNQLIGFGFTSVYLERIYKADGDDTLLIKNLQLSLLSIPISMINVLLQDSDTVSQHGLFFGYDGLVLTDVLFNALGGLIISLVLKHHDNITKIFSTSVSIVVTFVLSVFLFEKRFNEHFMIGMVHVFISIYLYYF